MMVDGWKAIADRMTRRTGIEISPDQARRYARRLLDPLPVRRYGGPKPRIVADVAAIDAWTQREYPDLADVAPSHGTAFADQIRLREGTTGAEITSGTAAPFLLSAKKYQRGFVYFIRAGSAIKIGWTQSDPRERLRQLQPACPVRMRLIGVIPDQMVADERRLHRQFSRLHLSHEWFEAADEVLAFIAGHAIDPLSDDK